MAKETAKKSDAGAPGDKIRNAAGAPLLLFVVGGGCFIGFEPTNNAALLFFIGGCLLLCFLTCCIIFALAHHADAVVRAMRPQAPTQTEASSGDTRE